MRLRAALIVLTVAAGGAAIPGGPASAALGSTERVSVSGAGIQAKNGNSSAASISADGRYVAFSSKASNLVPGDQNGVEDVFVHDRQDGTTERVSVSNSGVEAKGGGSSAASISADGRYVAFASSATNLVPNITNGSTDVFVHDRDNGVTTAVSLTPEGDEPVRESSRPSVSADGSHVAFVSLARLSTADTNTIGDVYVCDWQAGTGPEPELVTVADDPTAQSDGASADPAISADGQLVAFDSAATNLVPGDTNQVTDVFVRNVEEGTTELVSVSSNDQPAGNSVSPSISTDGRYVAFDSFAPLVPADTNQVGDVFLRDLETGTVQRVSVPTNSTTAEANRRSYNATISADARYVAFVSYSSNMVTGDTRFDADVFVRDRTTKTTERVSVATGGAETNGISIAPSISASGQHIAFDSTATGLVAGDSNGNTDVFVRDRLADITPPRTRITRGPANKGFVLSTRARMGFGSSERGSTYRCWLDGRRQPCGDSPTRLTSLAQRTHTFQVRAVDAAGNRDRSPAVRTWTVPRNNTSLRHHKGWVKRRGAGYYMRTYSKTRRKGAVLTSRVRNAKRLALVATKAPRNGKVEVYLGKRRLKRVGLSARVTRHRRVLPIATFKRRQSGTVKVVVVTARRTVRIEGLGVATR